MAANFLSRAVSSIWQALTLKDSREAWGLSPNSDSGEYVTPDSAMRITTAYACVRLLAEALASLPVRVYRKVDAGVRVRDDEHWLYELLALEPNQFQTSFEYREMVAMHLILRGAHYSRIYWDSMGRVKALIPLHPDSVSVNLSSDGTRLVYLVTDQAGKTETLGGDDVLHVRGLHGDITSAISPVTYAANTLGLDRSLAKHQARSFGPDAARPGGVIEAEGKVGTDVVVKILRLFNKQYAGSNNAGKTLFLDRGMKFKPIAFNNVDQQFLETRKFSVEEICRIFNVPPSLVHHNYNSTYSNAEQQTLSFVKFSLRPLVVRFEEAIQRALMTKASRRRYEVDLDMQDLLRGDAAAMSTMFKTLVSGGISSPNEARESLGFSRRQEEAADKLYMQTAMAPLDKLEELAASRNQGKIASTDGGEDNAPKE